MHLHIEAIVELEELDQEALEQLLVRISAVDQPWQLGGRYRGAHLPGGPYAREGVLTDDIGGVIFEHSLGVQGPRLLSSLALALPADLIWLGSAEARDFIERGDPVPDQWVLIRDYEPRELAVDEVKALDPEGLALATLDWKG